MLFVLIRNADVMYPFTTQKAILSVLDAKNKSSSYIDLPSLTCPDCRAYNGTYLAIPFEVETNQYKVRTKRDFYTDYSNYTLNASTGDKIYRSGITTTTSYEKYQEMFPTLNGTREREFLGRNRLVGGVLMTQTRVHLGSCPSLPRELARDFEGVCLDEEHPLIAAFGVDPTYVGTSSLFRETNVQRNLYTSSEVNDATNLPFGFFYDQGCIDCTDERYPVTDFPILFDVNFNVSHVATFMTLILEGNYIDSYTASVTIRFPLLSYELGRYILVTIIFNPVEVGNWNMKYNIDVLHAKINNWEGETAIDVWQCIIEVLFLLSWIVLTIIEAGELRQSVKQTGYIFKYIFDVGNVLDWINYGLQFGMIISWVFYVIETNELARSMQLRYDVYADYMATSRLTQVTQEMGKFQKLIGDLENLVDMRLTYSNFLCFSLLVTCLQTLKNLDFHPKMGLITKTISGAASDLIFFVILYLIVQVIYGFLAVLVFGKFSEAFSTFGRAFVTNQYLLLGVYEPQDDMEMAEQPLISTIYYWTYMLITFFILLNALLAIIVESYAGVKMLAMQEEGIDPLGKVFKMYLRKLTRPRIESEISDKQLNKVLKDMYNNTYAQKNAFHPGMKLLVKENFSWESDGKGHSATLISENLDGTLHVRYEDGSFAHVPDSAVTFDKLQQVRLPEDVAERIMWADLSKMKTLTRFYLINKGTVEAPKPALLDQVSLILALKTLVPTMHMKICMALSLNILTRYGHNADLNNDGVISPQEWEALEKVMTGLNASEFGRPTHHGNKTRLVNLMLH